MSDKNTFSELLETMRGIEFSSEHRRAVLELFEETQEMPNHLHLQGLIFDTPHFIAQSKLDDILAVVGPRLGMEVPEAKAAARTTPLSIDSQSVAMIRVHGTLVNRGAWIGAQSGLTSYDGLRTQVNQAKADSSIAGVILDIESYGGQAAGLADLVADIKLLDGVKPVYAVVNSHALSAAYGIASAARKIYMISDGLAGSIGVVAAHRDETAKNERDGVSYTIVHKGVRKADFSPHKPLSDEALGWLEDLVAESYDQFTALVAQNRNMPVSDVRGTQSAVFKGRTALKSNLVDYLMPADQAISSILQEISMSDEKKPAAGATAESNPETKAIVDAQLEKASEEAAANATAAERSRISDITQACSALNRPELASKFIDAGVPAGEARKQLIEAVGSEQPVIDNTHGESEPEASGWGEVVKQHNKANKRISV